MFGSCYSNSKLVKVRRKVRYTGTHIVLMSICLYGTPLLPIIAFMVNFTHYLHIKAKVVELIVYVGTIKGTKFHGLDRDW